MSGPAASEADAGPRRAGPFRLPTSAAINHLLRRASWARERLMPHARKVARFELIPFSITLVILDSGEVAYAPADSSADAVFQLTPGIAIRMLAGHADAWQRAQVIGDTALARDILYLAQNLRWDAEEDLSRFIGDIAAHRVIRGANELRRWHHKTVDSFARSTAIYLTEERPLIASRDDIENYVRAVDDLRDDTARLEKRIDRLLSRS